jgi:hypothetical protein
VSGFAGAVGDGVTIVPYHCQVLRLVDSYWIALRPHPEEGQRQGGVCVAMKTKFERMPLTSVLIGENDATEAAELLARHLSQRVGAQCFVTCSLGPECLKFIPDLQRETSDYLLRVSSSK